MKVLLIQIDFFYGWVRSGALWPWGERPVGRARTRRKVSGRAGGPCFRRMPPERGRTAGAEWAERMRDPNTNNESWGDWQLFWDTVTWQVHLCLFWSRSRCQSQNANDQAQRLGNYRMLQPQPKQQLTYWDLHTTPDMDGGLLSSAYKRGIILRVYQQIRRCYWYVLVPCICRSSG
jgi:hypothetical protein